MKKLVILFVLAFAFNQDNIKAQTVVNPIGDELTIIDINATDIELENRTTGETFLFNTTVEMYAAWSSLSCGKYKAEFMLEGERHRVRFNIDNCGESNAPVAMSAMSEPTAAAATTTTRCSKTKRNK